MRTRASTLIGLAAVMALGTAASVHGQFQFNRIKGKGRYEKIKGQPSAGYRELYETNLFLCPAADGQVIGRSRRLGTWNYNGSTCIEQLLHDGTYCIDSLDQVGGALNGPLVDGTYSILVHEDLFYVSPKVLPDVVIQGGVNHDVNVDLPIDYSTYVFDDWVGKTEVGDFRPPSSPWYQTFVATGTSVRGATCCYAGNDPGQMWLAVLEDNGDSNPANWALLGERVVGFVGGGLNDNWVRWRSGAIPTTPGTTYALRIRGQGGVTGGGIQPFILRGGGVGTYALGEAYDNNGVANGEDLNATVFSDNDGTVVTMNKRTPGMGQLYGHFFSTKCGQTFTAQGNSLAAVDFKASTGNESQWGVNIRYRIYEGASPGGPQVGVAKIINPAWNPFAFHSGVSYSPNTVRLTPGQSYFVECEMVNPPAGVTGFNPWIMNPEDDYAGGQAYRWNGTWVSEAGVDVHMTVLEYTLPPDIPLLSVVPDEIDREAFLGGTATGDDVFNVSNPGIGTVNYIVAESAAWFSVNPPAGSVTDEADPITITYDNGVISTLGVGVYVEAITVTSPEAENSPQTVTVTLMIDTLPPDFDGDLDVDQGDFGHLQACYSGPGISQALPECQDALLDDDDDVDQNDFSILQGCLSGEHIPADLACMN